MVHIKKLFRNFIKVIGTKVEVLMVSFHTPLRLLPNAESNTSKFASSNYNYDAINYYENWGSPRTYFFRPGKV